MTGCGRWMPDRWRSYFQVTSIVVHKASRKMYVYHKGLVLKEHDIDLGFTPVGGKRIEGDGKTPEGTYVIDRKNPDSLFHLSLGISYPNAQDIAQAKALGQSPGGDIFIHGQPTSGRVTVQDWTWGCIAVSNKDIEELYRTVRIGTPITIRP